MIVVGTSAASTDVADISIFMIDSQKDWKTINTQMISLNNDDKVLNFIDYFIIYINYISIIVRNIILSNIYIKNDKFDIIVPLIFIYYDIYIDK